MRPEELAEAGFYHSPRDKDADLVFMKNHIQLNNDFDCHDAYQVIKFKEYVDKDGITCLKIRCIASTVTKGFCHGRTYKFQPG